MFWNCENLFLFEHKLYIIVIIYGLIPYINTLRLTNLAYVTENKDKIKAVEIFYIYIIWVSAWHE